MTTDAFVRHYTAVADESPVPVLLYNFTAVTGVNLLPAAVARLAEHPNIVGMKESGGDIAQIAELVDGNAGRIRRPRRDDGDVLCRAVRRRGRAASWRSRARCRRRACGCSRSTREGRHDEARAMQRQLVPLAKLLGPTYGVPGLKAALNAARLRRRRAAAAAGAAA